jgi:hypothetical protein
MDSEVEFFEGFRDIRQTVWACTKSCKTMGSSILRRMNLIRRAKCK